MRSLDSFKSQKCLKKMRGDYLDKWIYYADAISEELDNGPLLKETAYTPHDFSNHVYDIYKIISNCILHDYAYEDKNRLSDEALFLLNIAVLFHDYSMSMATTKRYNHSEISRDKFINFCKNKVPNKSDKLSEKQQKVIGAIIYAHSDIKNKDGKTTVLTLESEEVPEINSADEDNNVPVRFLAGILRLADELDVTKERKNGLEDKIVELKEKAQEEEEEDFSLSNSLEHWAKLECFESLEIKHHTIFLKVSDMKYSEDSNRCEDYVSEVIEKIQREFTVIQEKCFSKLQDFIKCSDVKVDCINAHMNFGSQAGAKLNGHDRLKQQISGTSIDYCELNEAGVDNKACVTSMSSQETDEKTKSNCDTVINGNISIVAPRLSHEIDEFIIKEKLLLGGHFHLNDIFCTRDWVDSKRIIDDKEMRHKICYHIKKHFEVRLLSTELQNILFVGVEEYGAILASYLAFDLNLPVQYIIPDKDSKSHSLQDRTFKLPTDQSQVILFTEAIATGSTISKVIDDNDLTGKVYAVYSVVYRKADETILDKNYLQALSDNDIKLYSLNLCPNMVLFPKKDCPQQLLAKKNQEEFICMAHNIVKR